MASNNIELITKYSPKAWDTVYKQEARSSFLDTNPTLVKFVGAKTVKIGKFQSGGLNDYYRNNEGDGRVNGTIPQGADFVGNAGFGYQKSNVRLVWEEFTLACDRAAAFQIEKFDNEESGEELVGLGVTEISRTTIVPEVDAYCFAKIATYCDTNLGNLATAANANEEATPLKRLNSAFLWLANHEVPENDQIVFASPNFVNQLRNSAEVTKYLGQSDFAKNVSFQILEYQGRKIIEVAPDRFRTGIVLGAGGYSWGAGSTAIDFIMCAKSAVMHIVKYEKVKVIGDDLNLAGNGFDGYTIYARIYHDVFVPDNKRVAVYTALPFTARAVTVMSLDVEWNEDDRIESITTYPGEKIAITCITSDASPESKNVGDTLTNVTQIGVGYKKATVNGTYYIFAIDTDKKILAKTSYTVA